MVPTQRVILVLVVGAACCLAGCGRPAPAPPPPSPPAAHQSPAAGAPPSAAIEEFHHAIAAGDVSRVRAMLRADRRLARADYATFSPMQLAAYKGQVAVVKLLLKAGVRADAGRTGVSSDWTPLHWAALGRHPDVVRLLIENGADLNALGAGQKTALHQAVEQNDLATARILLESGADVNAVDDRGFTPLHIALERGSGPLADLIRSYGGRDQGGG
ncbi:MAG: ankyrin repeat domain-containing protein [Chthonomonadales bacterium]